MKLSNAMKKGISVLLALNLVLSSAPVPTFAVGEEGLCDHHTEHTPECGYVAAVAGSPCSHTHDDTCGYTEAREAVPCTCEPAEDGTHQEDCGYAEAVAGSPCTHIHDELCGYAEAVEGQPCGYECGECAAEAEAYSDLGIGYICAAGNGSSSLGSWVNGESWYIEAESNIMTEVAANVYEITYTDLPASNNYKLKFAADGVWAKSWGGTYNGSGVESDAVLGGPEISFPVSHGGSDVTLKLDLTGYDPDTQTGATFTVTVIPPDLGYTYDEETNTYTVTTANGLFAVAELMDGGDYSANITLAADIVLNENLADKVTVAEDGTVSADASVRKWTPMGENGLSEYSGTFDGGNHTITGLYCVYNGYSNTGLISNLAEGATVKNVKIHDFCLGIYGGAIVGNNWGEVIGCSISGTGILGWDTWNQCVGGVVGVNEGTVKDCTSSAAMTFHGTGYFGGIVGNNITSQATVIGCSNSGTITAAGYSEMKVGGIAGQAEGTVSGCYNTGSIRAAAEDGSVQVGGIVGWMKGTVSGCYNTGTVSGKATAEASEAYVGGIAGYAEGPVSGCYNTGNISGDATGDTTGDEPRAYVGGITSANNGPVSGCYNIGSIDGDTYSGSIAAFAYGTFADCYYLDTCVKSGNTEQSSADGITAKTEAQFASGEVAYLLNGDQSTITYTQTLGSDAAPSFTGGTVYRVGVTCTENAVAYANTQSDLDHNYTDGICTACGEACDHSGSTNTAVTDRGNGTHGYDCTVCGAVAAEDHAMDVTTGKCGECGADMTAIATVTDGTNTCYAADAATLNQAVTAILETGSSTFTVELPADAEAGMITAIRRAICDTEGVIDGSIHLTLKGVTTIPGTTNWDGVAFGPRNAQWDENNVEIVSHEEVTQLASINLPDVTEIGAQAFLNCSNLTSITAPKVQSIGDWGLQSTAITSIDMPLLKEAGFAAFQSTALTEVSLPSLETAGVIVFGQCNQLRTVDLPKLQNLSQQLFTRCTSLVSVSAPAATSMGINVFKGCSELVSITLPGVTELTNEAFAECTKLENITLGSVITKVNVNLFAGEALSSGITLTLSCGQENAETLSAAAGTNVAWAGFTWKEVKLAHSYVNGKCTACGEDCAHTGGEATCTAPAVCITCGTSYGEKKPHSFNDSGFCTVCNTAAQAKLVANSDGTVTYFATLPEALAAEHNPWDEVYALADYEGDITVPAGLCFYGENHTFSGDVLVEGGRIFSGTFNGEVQVYLIDTVEEGVAQGFIYGGTFRKAVFVGSQCVVYGGTFEAELELVGSDVFNFAGDKYHFALGENFTLILDGDTTIDCREHIEPLGFDCTVGKLCRLCREVLTDPQAAHTGSNSTCSTKGACQVCGTLYLDPDVHAGECTNGIWTCCGKYQIPEQDADGVYEIDNAGKLFWFAAQVNSGNTALNARLTADIDLENRAWTPIGNVDNLYKGSFDGSGKTIKGLYIHDEAAQYVGLFGAIYLNAHVKAVTLTDSSVTGKDYVGGIVGRNSGTVTGCVNNAVVSGSGSSTGGIAGENGGTVELCGNTNTVTSNSSGCGGIVGRNGGTIRNCYNTGEVRATKTTGVAGGITYLNMDTVEYSWSTGKVTGGSNGEEGGIVGRNTDAVRYCCATQKAIGSSQYGATTNNVGTYTAAQFASGEVAYMLSSASEGELVWGQTIGTDPYPVLGGAQVYHGYTSCGDTAAIYTNDETISPEKPAHTGEADYTPTGDGKQHIAKWSCCGTEVTEAHSGGTATCQTQAVCQHCGASYGELDPDNHEYETNNGICCDTYQSAALNAEGFYEIFNAGQLYWFARQVNNGDTTINAILMNDIVINSQVLDADGNLISDTSGLRQWTPIGHYNSDTDNLGFAGTFDGNGKTIRGLYHYGDTARYAGLFGYSSGMIQDLTIADSYIHTTHSDGRAGSVTGLNEGTVSNCSNYGIVVGVNQVGGIIGRIIAGLVENCTNYGTVNSTTHAGGICGCASGGTINNCCNTGSVKADSGVGGIAGSMQNTSNISNCISVGTVEGSSQAGGVVGYVLNNSTTNATITNCYHDNTICGYDPVGVNGGSYASATVTSVEGKTTEQFASGEIAYLLGSAWGQTIGTDSYPVLGGKTVYEIKVCDKTAYSNTDEDIPHNFDEKGFCTATPGEVHYQPAPDSDSDGFFEIGNAGQLFWFANHINTVDRTASAVLTADIDLEGRPWTPIGSTGESSNNFRGTFDGQNHTIRGLYVEGGRAGLGFFGEVRTGTVKNFTIYGEVVANTEVNYVGGVIGSICGLNGENDLERNGAVIQNITSFVNVTAKAHGIGMIGGFVGYANHQSLIEKCAWYGTFDAGIYRVDSGAGGFIGKIQENTSEVTIRNCGAYGTIKTNYAGDYNNTPTIYMGGFLSFSNTNAKTTLENCLFAGRFERGANLTDQAFLGAFGTLRSVNAIKNCYYLGDDGLEAVHSDSNLKPGSDNVEITSVTGKDLRGERLAIWSRLGKYWTQGIHYPILKEGRTWHSDSATYTYTYTDNGDGTHKKTCNECGYVEEVKEEHYVDPTTSYTDNGDGTHKKTCYDCGAVVANEAHSGGTATCTEQAECQHCGASYGAVDKTNHDTENAEYDNGFCTVCDAYEPATDSDSNNYYEIDNAGKLYWFAAQVNSGKTNINGELKANIVINEDVLAEMIRINPDPSRFRLWTPIGTPDNAYVGDFCGFEHTVSGLYFNDSNADYVGLFGYVGSGTVNHVGVIDSYFNGSGAVGGVVGYNEGTVEYAYSNSYVGGIGCIGGVVGYNQSTVKYAYNTGTVSGDLGVGGVVGSNQSTVKYAYNTGSVSGETNVGGVAGENFDTATVTNCYFDSTVYTGNAIGTDFGTATDVEGKTTEQFASGEVAYLLGYPFGQAIGTNSLPVLYGETVYYGYTSCGDVQMVYTNDSKASTEKPEHTGEATYTLTEDGAQHIASYSCCGTTVTEDHTYENGFCPCGLYDLWVAGEQISESKLTVSGTTGTATYDPATDTLTLNGFDNGEKWCSFTSNDGVTPDNAAVYTLSDLNVVLEGENSLFASGDGFNMAIQSQAALTIGGDGTLDAGTIYSANGTTINGGTLNLAAETVFDGPSTTIKGGNVNVHALLAVTFETLTVTGGRVVLESSDRGVGRYGTILIGEGMAVYDANGAFLEKPDFKTLQYALIRVPCDHTQATASYTWTEDPITLKVTVSCTACGETFTGSTEDIDVTISDDGFTTTYTATVTLDGKEYTASKKVTNQVTSVNIAWGSMEFTYTEDETGKGAWGSPDGANRITVTNTGNTAVTVTAAYTQAEGYEEIKGKFFASETSTHTEPAAAGETAEFYLYLEGEPNKALKNTTVGTVTVSIR